MTRSLKFGTSGLRGLAADFDRDVCARYVAAFLDMLEDEGARVSEIAVGMDLRQSSPSIAAWCCEAATCRGLNAIDTGRLPTPALAAYAIKRGIPALMVTASHNPAEYNGIKFYRPHGELTKADEAVIKANRARPPRPATEWTAMIWSDAAAAREYVARYTALFPRDALEGLRLGIDQHSAVGRDLLVEILTTLGARCKVVRRSDSFVAVDTEALDAPYVAMARDWLATGTLDALVSTDGDGDRPLVFDETGRQLLGDDIGILTARYLGYTRVVTPVSSTTSVESCGWFESVARCRIGSPYVIECMERMLSDGAEGVAGFEGNGGFLTGGRRALGGREVPALMTRDAVLPIVAVLAMAREQQVSLGALVGTLPHRAKATGRLANIDTTVTSKWIEGLIDSTSLRERTVPMLTRTESVQSIDGARFILTDGSSIHFRLSGNAPELRCYVETEDSAKSEQALTEALSNARAAIAAAAPAQ